ncbi:unnamed protein product, partial [Staurois parvus]
MALGRKGLTSGAIKGLTVCCVLLCRQAALYCSAVHCSCTLLWMAVHSTAIQSSV